MDVVQRLGTSETCLPSVIRDGKIGRASLFIMPRDRVLVGRSEDNFARQGVKKDY